MTMVSVESIGQDVFECVTRCREDIKEGKADLAGLQDRVRDYCAAIAGLTEEERALHEQHLQVLMQEVEALGKELVAARNATREELEGLGRVKQANVAYHKSDAIGSRPKPKIEEEQ